METSSTQLTAKEIITMILDVKSKDPYNFRKIQKLQQQLDACSIK